MVLSRFTVSNNSNSNLITQILGDHSENNKRAKHLVDMSTEYKLLLKKWNIKKVKMGVTKLFLLKQKR